ncbi:MAG: hypothetical protein E7595_02830 [Ruminococcaceae bacterium]|nr:hypothetical protein [Oscillospiraceae bacterium]
MKAIKHILALCLSITMIFSMILSAGVMNASAIAGGGLQSSTYRAYGADLSFWNVNGSSLNYSLVDFAKMKADGCQFVILRIGFEGSSSRTNTLDTAFVEYYNRARAAGMPLGVYFYSLATTYNGAVEDANWVANKIEQYGMYFEYPIYYDVEDSGQTSLGSSAMESLCLGWCETLEARGYFPGVYGGASQVIDKLSSSFKSKYDLWYPRVKINGHGTQYNPNNYDYSYYCGMWQYAWYDYEYNGIGLDMLDVNVCYKNYPQIMSQYGYNNCKPAESEAKRNLKSLIDTVGAGVRYHEYSASQLNTLRTAYNNAVSVYNSSDPSDSSCTSAYNTLNAAYNPAFSVISQGKSYTVNATNRTDDWVDNGTKLTDGVKGTVNGGTAGYAGWGDGTGAQIVIDLGASHGNHNGYRVYGNSHTEWGIFGVSEIVVEVSNDNVTYTKIAAKTQAIQIGTDDSWQNYRITAWADSMRSERYVRISVNHYGNHTWLEEVEVGSGEKAINNAFYIDAVNEYIYAGDCHVFTSAMGTITTSNANHSWCNSVVAKWNSSKNAYVVTKKINGIGTETESVTLASDEILIAAHGWEGTGVEAPIVGSMANYNAVGALEVGATFTLNGVDLNNKSVQLGAYGAYNNIPDHDHVAGEWVVVTPAGLGSEGVREQHCTVCGATVNSAKIPALTEADLPDNAKTFWVTHISDNTIEGAGVIFTQAYEGAAWWLHVAFSPVSGKSGVFEITAISDGTDLGDATALSIPAGGFVWAINYGNNYPDLYPDDTTAIDYTSPNCTNATNDALTWAVGDKFVFYGINPLTPTVATSTPDTKWYDDAYVCTSYYAPYSEAHVHTPGTAATCTSAQTCTTCGEVLEAAKGHTAGAWVTLSDGSKEQRCSVCNFLLATQPAPENKGKLGDVNLDGAIDQYDYILVKRHYFETRYLTDDEMARADVNLDGNINQYDYILIKRHYFGTYVIG